MGGFATVDDQPHTVTQSSPLSICNATQQPDAFKSGMQDAGFEFSVPVNDQSTIYYFCGVPGHCQKGMVRDVHKTAIPNHRNKQRRWLTASLPTQFGLINVRPRRFCIGRTCAAGSRRVCGSRPTGSGRGPPRRQLW